MKHPSWCFYSLSLLSSFIPSIHGFWFAVTLWRADAAVIGSVTASSVAAEEIQSFFLLLYTQAFRLYLWLLSASIFETVTWLSRLCTSVSIFYFSLGGVCHVKAIPPKLSSGNIWINIRDCALCLKLPCRCWIHRTVVPCYFWSQSLTRKVPSQAWIP